MKQLEVYIDGASKGNPGDAGIGIIISQGDEVLKNIAQYIGKTTNNYAEYMALIYALQEALLLKAESLNIYTDSQLLCRQINKEYKVKNPNILGLYNQARHLAAGFKQFQIKHIARESNRGADKLANKAIRQAIKKK
ncbi:MAG: ribonuclease HI family protein [Candidatus Omnitrophica bacterium]|nr:ribonuclease HI family protein [Candidatus Omnitrophota bacterium]